MAESRCFSASGSACMGDIGNPAEAFREFPGPVLLLAGPGTGKTFQLVRRVKYLVEEKGAAPDQMTVITFTTEAARNMREALADPKVGLPGEAFPKIISTMHSLANTIVGAAASDLGLPEEYRIVTESDPKSVLMSDAAFISTGDRGRGQDTEECRVKGRCREDAAAEKCRICLTYQSLLRKCGAIDYDDQVFLACKALRESASLAAD